MVVETRKLAHTKFYEAPNIIEKDMASKYAVSPLLIRSKRMADFIIADIDKSSVIVLEMKRGVGRAGVRQIPSYLRTPAIAGNYYILRPETDVHHGGILVHKGIETLPKLGEVTTPIEVSYPNQTLVETLLGSKGMSALEQVLSVVNNLTRAKNWPLDRVEVRYVRDPEVEDWEYILLVLVFTCDFDAADRYLHELYNQIDLLTGKLSDEEQEVLRRMIFFDIKTKASISSA